MKKTLNDIFDEASASEIEDLVNRNAAPTVSDETLLSVKDKVYAKTGLKKKDKSRIGIWMRFGAIAACLALTIGAVIMIQMPGKDDPAVVPGPETSDSSDADLPSEDISFDSSFDSDGEGISFDSLDKVNFYGGLKAIAESTQNKSTVKAGLPSASRLLSRNNGLVGIMSLSKTDSDDAVDLQTADTDNIIDSDIVYVDLTPIKITKAIYFKINVTEDDSLLASKIGEGEAEVVVTELYIHTFSYPMITFKHGNKYFSCISSSTSRTIKSGMNSFASNCYIRGFKSFKEPLNESVISFKLVLGDDNETVESLGWKRYNRVPPEAVLHSIEVFSETVRFSNDTHIFTLDELSAYWGSEEHPEGETVASSETLPEIYDDGQFRYYLINGEYYEIEGIYKSYYKDIVIPDSLFECPIKGIQACAFQNFKYLRTVVIPDSVEYIGDYAFSDCDNLTAVTMPNGVKLGVGAFDKDYETVVETCFSLPDEDMTENIWHRKID